MLWPTHHQHLYYLLISLCNYQIPWFPYLYLRPPCLSLSDLTLLLLMLLHSCKYQNFQALATLNTIFAFWVFKPTLQNLQRLLIFPMSLPNIMNLLMFSAKPKLKFSFLIVLMIFKSIWKKVLNLQLVLYTLFQHLNKRLLRNSLRKISIWILSDQPPFCMVYQFYLLRRKIAHYTFMSTSIVLIAFPKRITIYSHSSPIYWTYLAKLGFIQTLLCLPLGLYCHW